MELLDASSWASSSTNRWAEGTRQQENRSKVTILYFHQQPSTWDAFLSAAQFAYNNSVQETTGFRPFNLDGVHPFTLIALLNPLKSQPAITDRHDSLGTTSGKR